MILNLYAIAYFLLELFPFNTEEGGLFYAKFNENNVYFSLKNIVQNFNVVVTCEFSIWN